MEDGENGAKRLWNGYTREKIIDFYQEKSITKMKKCLNWVEKKTKTTFGKLSQRPIELKEFWSLSFRVPLLVEGSMLEGYRCVTIL